MKCWLGKDVSKFGWEMFCRKVENNNLKNRKITQIIKVNNTKNKDIKNNNKAKQPFTADAAGVPLV